MEDTMQVDQPIRVVMNTGGTSMLRYAGKYEDVGIIAIDPNKRYEKRIVPWTSIRMIFVENDTEGDAGEKA
jgi:hypothetical protein